MLHGIGGVLCHIGGRWEQVWTVAQRRHIQGIPGLLDSKKSAVIVSVAAGFLADALGGSGYSLSPLYYLAAATLICLLSEKVLPVFFSYAMILIPALIVRAGYTLLSILISYGSLPLLFTLKDIILPEAICTLLLCLPLWPLTRLCTSPLGSRNKFTF